MPRSYRDFTIAFVAALLVIYILIFSMTMNNTTSVSAVEANGVGVYWDSNCSNEVSSIDWGTLEPGSVKNITVYIQNEVDEPQFLSMSTINWNPSKASDYITLRWNYTGRRIDPGEVLQIKLILSVSRYVKGILNFSFDILIAGSQNLPGDINGDGIVDILDVSTVCRVYASGLYYRLCDFDMDGDVDISDIGTVCNCYVAGYRC